MGFRKNDNYPATQGGYSAVSVDQTATEIVAENKHRVSLLIQNQGTTILYLGFDNSVTADNYAVALTGGTARDDGNGSAWETGGVSDVYEGAVYGIRQTVTAENVTYSEVTDVS